jgi:hypothetical protein
MCFEREPPFAGARGDAFSPIGACPIHSLARCRYAGMKTFLASLVALVVLSSRAYAEPRTPSVLPSAPIPSGGEVAPLWAVAWSLAGSAVVAWALDWTFERPTALVKSKVGFAAFEAGTSGLSILAHLDGFTAPPRLRSSPR